MKTARHPYRTDARRRGQTRNASRCKEKLEGASRTEEEQRGNLLNEGRTWGTAVADDDSAPSCSCALAFAPTISVEVYHTQVTLAVKQTSLTVGAPSSPTSESASSDPESASRRRARPWGQSTSAPSRLVCGPSQEEIEAISFSFASHDGACICVCRHTVLAPLGMPTCQPKSRPALHGTRIRSRPARFRPYAILELPRHTVSRLVRLVRRRRGSSSSRRSRSRKFARPSTSLTRMALVRALVCPRGAARCSL